MITGFAEVNMLLSTDMIADRVKNGFYDAALSRLYTDVEAQKSRMLFAVSEFEKHFGKSENTFVITAPGRTEVAGNHTDHQQGIVLAASVSLDAMAVVSKRDDMKIGVLSRGYTPFEIDISNTDVKKSETGKSSALIRGVADGFLKRDLKVGGFDIYVSSDVLSGSGLSSSACFEVLIGTVFSYLYNEDSVAPYKIALIGQYSENKYFGKPCGLMDQMACAVGGLIRIDFKDKELPDFNKVIFEPEKYGYNLCIVDTGGSHADLTDDYAAVPAEMKSVAKFFGKEALREVDEKEFYEKLPEIRKKLGDRAVLRASHFYNECIRVKMQTECLEKGDFEGFLSLVREAGISAVMYNQNAYTNKKPDEQGITLGLMMCEKVLGKKGAFRLQGGGFAGTIQAYVPNGLLQKFKEEIEHTFGEGKCYVLNVRQSGAVVF